MPVARKKCPSAILWSFIAGIAFFGFGLQCYFIGINLIFHEVTVSENSSVTELVVAVCFFLTVVVMMVAIVKLIQSRP